MEVGNGYWAENLPMIFIARTDLPCMKTHNVIIA
jgi:hypothetical protein